MSVPPRLLALMDLARAVATGAFNETPPPVRLEVPAEGLVGSVGAPLGALLARAVVLAPRCTGRPSSAILAGIGAAAVANDLYLELVTRGVPALRDLGEAARIRAVRVKALFDRPADASAAIPEAVAAAALTAGRVVLATEFVADELPLLLQLISELGKRRSIVDLRAVPKDEPSRARALDQFPAIDHAGRAASLNLRVDGVGWTSAGVPRDPLAPHEVLAEGYRAIFRAHPGICPFPFVMLAVDAAGVARPCPRPDGPDLGPLDATTWSGPAAAVRGAHLRGNLPAPCVDCSLSKRVRESLARSNATLAAMRRPDLAAPGSNSGGAHSEVKPP